MTVPVGQNLQTLASGIFQRGKLVAGCKGEMLRRMVDVLHPIILGDGVALSQQVAARLVGCVLLGLGNHFINYMLWYGHFNA